VTPELDAMMRAHAHVENHIQRLKDPGLTVMPFTNFAPYNRGVVSQRAKTIVEWAERMRSAGPPSEDDVTVLLDGRRLNSREAIEAWLNEVEAMRVLEAATRDIAL
jgi:hypothetical protein